MSLLTREELKELVEQSGHPSVSIFIPTRQAGPETRENPIKLKNQIDQAKEKLVEFGKRPPEAEKFLAPLQELVDDYDFWQHQSQGLALFLSPELFRHYRVPVEFEELTVVADQFHLKPLMPLLSGDGQFYLLALSQNNIRLLHGSRHHIEEVELEDVPESLAEALRFDEPRKHQQFHTATVTPGSQTGGGRPAMFHGHGVTKDEDKEKIVRYFHQVDDGMQEMLQNEEVPLVLAGVEFLLPLYRKANSYHNLLDDGVTGNPEELRPEELHRQAWAILEPHFKQDQEEARSRYHDLSNTDQASSIPREIISAAYYGKVDTLFVAVGHQQWGQFDPDSNTVTLHQTAEAGDQDLLDAAAVQTLLNGGTVYAVAPEAVPADSPAAAIFRY